MAKEPACNGGTLDLGLWVGKTPGEGNGDPVQYSLLVGLWVGKTPGEGNGDPVQYSLLVGLWVGKTLWRREWQPSPVFSPGESQDR